MRTICASRGVRAATAAVLWLLSFSGRMEGNDVCAMYPRVHSLSIAVGVLCRNVRYGFIFVKHIPNEEQIILSKFLIESVGVSEIIPIDRSKWKLFRLSRN